MTIPAHWLFRRSPALAAGRLLCALALLAATGAAVHAQELGGLGAGRAQGPGVPTPAVFYSSTGPLTATLERYRSDPRPKSSEGAFQMLDWLVYGGIGWGLACDYNLNSTSTNQEQACGPRFTPSIVAERNTGIQRTLLYGVGDVRYYPTLSRVDLVDTTAGIVHVWEIQRDLIFRFQAQGTRGQEYSGFAANLLATDAFLTKPLNFNRGYGSTSIQKEFGNFFTAIGGSVTRTEYEDITDNLGNTIDEGLRNNTFTTLNGRIGYHISPIIYTYIEPSLNRYQYTASHLDSNGYRVVAGLGSGRIGLFNGEIYAGYATQRFDDPTVGETSIPVVGGRLSWYPTRFLTHTFTADRTFASSDFSNNGVLLGSVTNTGTGLLPGSLVTSTTARLNSNWDVNRFFDLSWSISDQRLEYLNSSRRDDLLTFVGGVTFKIRPGLGIQVNYIHQNLFTNFPGAEFTRDFVSVGAQSRF